MKSISSIEIILILGSLLCMQFSIYGWVKIIATLLLLGYLIYAKTRIRQQRAAAVLEVINQLEDYDIYKEKNRSYYIFSLSFIFLAVTNIKSMMVDIELLTHGAVQHHSFLEVMSHFNIDQAITACSYAFFIILAIVFLIEGIKGKAIMTEDKLICYNGTIFDLSETELLFKTTWLLKRQIIIARCNGYEQQLYL